MNERILELAEQARKYARDYVAECKHYGYYMEHNEYELRFEGKFAELIVRECIGCCDEVDRINKAYIEEYCVDPENGPKECIQVIKAHFGVEE